MGNERKKSGRAISPEKSMDEIIDEHVRDSQMVAESIAALLSKFEVSQTSKITAMMNIIGQIYGTNKYRKGLDMFIEGVGKVYEFWEKQS